MTSAAVTMLWKDIRSKYPSMKFLFTSRLNQACLCLCGLFQCLLCIYQLMPLTLCSQFEARTPPLFVCSIVLLVEESVWCCECSVI